MMNIEDERTPLEAQRAYVTARQNARPQGRGAYQNAQPQGFGAAAKAPDYQRTREDIRRDQDAKVSYYAQTLAHAWKQRDRAEKRAQDASVDADMARAKSNFFMGLSLVQSVLLIVIGLADMVN